MASKKTKTPSEKSAIDTTSSTSNSSENRRNFYVVYKDGVSTGNLTFDESWNKFTEALETDNPCSVYRQHEEMRVDKDH